MSKVLIDRELLAKLVDRYMIAELGFTDSTAHYTQKTLDTPSGTPEMPVKAYYHEAPNEYGGLNKSVGLEVRRGFADAPLVLESDALARIACLEGEIAKRDARIVELESQYQRDVFGLNNEGDPIGGEPAGGYANDNARLRAELAALKAQEPVAWTDGAGAMYSASLMASLNISTGCLTPLYAAPVPEAKAQGVVMPELRDFEEWWCSTPILRDSKRTLAEKAWIVARLNAAPVQQPKCRTCDDNGRIGGPSFYAPDEGGEPCPDCCAPVQQVSVPECFTKLLHHAHGMTLGADWNKGTMASYHREPLGEAVVQCPAWLAAAPAAPAADACKACKGTGRRPIGGRGRIFGLTNRCFECQPLTDEEVYGQVTAHE